MNKEILHIFYDNGIKATLSSSPEQYLSESAWQEKLLSLMDVKEFQRTCYHDGMKNEYADIIVKIDNWKMMTSPLVKEYFAKTVSNQLASRVRKTKENNESVLRNNQNSIDTMRKDTTKEELLPPFVSKALEERRRGAGTIIQGPTFTKSKINEEDKMIPSFISQALTERQEKTNQQLLQSKVVNRGLKVNRKNKYAKFIVSVVAGTLVVAALTAGGVAIYKAVNKKDSTVEYKTEKASSNIATMSALENGAQLPIVTPILVNNDSFEIGLDINDVAPISSYEQEAIALKYEDRSQDTKAIQTKARYGDLIAKNAKKCGVDPNIVLGIATQESGNHEYGLREGSQGGLMQIEMSTWRGQEITYYDFDDNAYYVIKITDENVKDVDNNILIGCAILQNELKTFNYNILLAVQSYNMGYPNMNKILDATSINTGMTKTQIINDSSCLDWLNYTHVPGCGDPNYINNVLSWTGYGYHFYEFSCKDENGNLKNCTTLPIDYVGSKAI